MQKKLYIVSRNNYGSNRSEWELVREDNINMYPSDTYLVQEIIKTKQVIVKTKVEDYVPSL